MMRAAIDDPALQGGAGLNAAAPIQSQAPHSPREATERFRQLAPTMAVGGSAHIRAEIIGVVRYRQGDGMLLEICPGDIAVEVCSCDAVCSWTDEDCRFNAVVPFPVFHRYVVEGAIRLVACSEGSTRVGHPPPSSDAVWGELASISDAPGATHAASPFVPVKPSQENAMSQRLDYYKASREATSAMINLEKSVTQFGLEPELLELVRLRASQINGCAYCVDHHITEAKKLGEPDRRLHGVLVWRETPFFTPREQAALAWTESLTRLADTHAPDEDYELLRAQFSDKEIVDLTVAIIAVNGWNRLGVGFRRSPEN